MAVVIQQDGGRCETCNSTRTHLRYCDENGELIKYNITENDKICPQCGGECNTVAVTTFRLINIMLRVAIVIIVCIEVFK